YLAIIGEFDGMLALMDALWLSSVVTDSQYARGVYEWKRRILRLAGQIRQIASRAVLAARRKAAGDERSEAPSVEADILAAAGAVAELADHE
ncbi:MAG TPA: hypothetical protein DIT03_13455, partial [Candidatus Accumulibacter sp.]|nr:hypothetical protein [Accumulibacter sp.]